MAFTSTLRKQSVFGDQRVMQYLVTADAASGSVNTSLGFVECIAYAPASMASAGVIMRANALGGSTSSVGYVGFDGCANGDAFYLTVFGY